MGGDFDQFRYSDTEFDHSFDLIGPSFDLREDMTDEIQPRYLENQYSEAEFGQLDLDLGQSEVRRQEMELEIDRRDDLGDCKRSVGVA